MKKIYFAFFLPAVFLTLPLFVFAQAKSYNRARSYDVQHYTIRLSFDPATKTVFGDTTVQLKPLKNNFSTVTLDAVGMKYESVRLENPGAGGGGKNLKYRQLGEKITVTLDKSYAPEELISIRFKYSCRPAKGIYFVPAGKEHSAQIWTQGEPEEAHHWFPSYDFPDDKATTEQFLTVKSDETAVANGELLGTEQNPNGTKTVHYKMSMPHSVYLTSFVIGKYVKIEDQYKDVPLGYYVYPGTESIVPKAYGKTKEMFRVFEQLTGIDYPYNKYDQTIVASFTFGGMENITATTMADTEIFGVEILPGAVEDLVSHELAHSWFGNLVTCRNWAELWLNEGFATFMEAAWRERAYGRDDYLRKIREDADRFLAEDSVSRPGRRHGLFNQLARPDETIFDTTTYQKGGAVVHTLREEVGDENFWKAVNIYLNRHKFANVETPDLKRAMEEAAGRDLTWFFNQWVYKAGYPKIEVRTTYDARANRLNLAVAQAQTPDAVTPSAFVLPVEVEIETTGETKREKIRIDKRAQNFSISIAARPTKINFDPDLKVPLKTVKMLPIAAAAAASAR